MRRWRVSTIAAGQARFSEALANRGRALLEIGDLQAAFEHFEKARVIAPELEVVLLGQARLFIVFGGRLKP